MNAARKDESGDELSRNPITGTAGCCARAANGHAAAPPSPAMNSRRRINFPFLVQESLYIGSESVETRFPAHSDWPTNSFAGRGYSHCPPGEMYYFEAPATMASSRFHRRRNRSNCGNDRMRGTQFAELSAFVAVAEH